MRPSKRTTILDATVRVIEERGVTAVSYDSVAEAADLTKGGIQYHFPSRESLLQAVQEHLVERWEAMLADALGGAAEDATADERLAAYAQIGAEPSSRAELLLMVETAADPELHAPWQDAFARWAPTTPAGPLDAHQLDQITVRLAADGLWVHDFLSATPLPPEVRSQVADHLAALARGAANPR